MYVHCSDFISQLDFTPQEQLIAFRLVEELEPTGWIDVNLNDIAKIFDTDLDTVSSVLACMQNIEPAGLFAQNLSECLTLQAKDKNILSETLALILDNLHLLGSGKFDLLKRRCVCSDEILDKNIKLIKSLDPKPGLQFSTHLRHSECC